MTVEATSLPTTDLVASGVADSRRTRLRESGLLAGRLGFAVAGAGLLVIGFGWYGISGDGALIDGQTDVRAQLPYLLSGGFLGLGLVVLGAALIIAQSTRVERARSEALIEARFDALTSALGGTRLPVAPEGFVVAGAAAYHRADCRLVDGKEGQDYVSVDTAEDAGLRPCRVCLG